MKKIIVVAIIIRLWLIPFFYHPDIKSQHFHFQFLKKGILNIYQHTQDNHDTLPYKDTFNYLPLTYYVFGATNATAQILTGPQLNQWLNDWGPDKNANPNIPLFMLVLKLPYLFLDIGVAFLLFKIYQSKKLFRLWLLNPLSLYFIYILGNFDILPVFLTLLSFYFLQKKKTNLSFFVLGLAIALKAYPILFLPFFLFHRPSKNIHLLKHSLIATLPLIITLLPFANQAAFRQSFMGSGLTQKILETNIASIPIFPLTYLLIFLKYIKSSRQKPIHFYLFSIFAFFAALVNFHPQWLLWFLPFTLVNFHQKKYRYLFCLVFFLCFSYIFLYNDNYLFWGHLIPVNSLFVRLTSPFNFLQSRLSFSIPHLQNNLRLSILIPAIVSYFFL